MPIKIHGATLGSTMLKSQDVGNTEVEVFLPKNPGTLSTLIDSSVTYKIGTGYDYDTINEAIEDLSNSMPVYINSGIKVTLELQAGFVMAEQVLNRGLNLGWITITGVDAETTITHTALTTDFTTDDYDFASYPAFGVSKGGSGPTIDQLFNMGSPVSGTGKHGVMAVGASSSIDVMPDAGVKNAGENGIGAYRASTINARGAYASGAGAYGIISSESSTVNAEDSDVSGAGSVGIYANESSTINANSVNASNADTYGIYANATSTITANGADASNAGVAGLRANAGSTINISGTTTNITGSNGVGIYASDGSTINAESVDISGANEDAIRAYGGSTINATGADASGAGTYGVRAYRASIINADAVDASGCGLNGFYASRASTITANDANALNANGGSNDGFLVTSIGIIERTGASGTYSQSLDVWTGSGYIS